MYKLLENRKNNNADNSAIAIQLTRDKFYNILFEEICKSVKFKDPKINIHLIVTSSINGAVGIGIKAILNRTFFVNFLRNRKWINNYKKFNANVGYRSSDFRSPLLFIIHFYWALKIWTRLKSEFSNSSGPLLIDGIEIQDLLIDSYLRYKPSPCFNIEDPFVLILLVQLKIDIVKASRYFLKAKPNIYLTSYSVYIEHGIAVRVAINLGIKVVSFGNLQTFGKFLTKDDYFHTANVDIYRSGFAELNFRAEKIQAAENLIKSRFEGVIDSSTSYMKQSAYQNSEGELPSGMNGSTIIFLHDFFDCPHIYPDFIFNDFWSWVCLTIEELTDCGLNFYLKPHPSQMDGNDFVIKKLNKKYKNLKWIGSGINNITIAKNNIRCGVSVYGTIGHELAYLGIPTICCAKHPHINFNFCHTAKTVEAYKFLLRSANVAYSDIKAMKEEALEFIYMHNLNSSPNEKILKDLYIKLRKEVYGDDAADDILKLTAASLGSSQAFNEFIDKNILKTS